MQRAVVEHFFLEHGLPPELVDALLARLDASAFDAEGSVEASEEAGAATFVADDVQVQEVHAADTDLPPRYQDRGRIGVGGMGEVRRVLDRKLGRTCAWKVVRADLASRPAVVARFVEEAQVGAQLQHPNIPPVYDGGRLPDGRPWFSMKEVRGGTLADEIREAHRVGWTEAALRRLGDVFATVCDAVGYAHDRGVVHRDLKPDNVMVGPHGEVYVLDWGLAKVVGRPERMAWIGELEPEVASPRTGGGWRTRAGGVVGTAAYMPPEQARGEVDQLDARSDVYALGAMLYEILAGRPPYDGADARDVLRQVLAGPPDPIDAGVAPVPEELGALCASCMARDPADRPVDGGAVALLARSWLDGARKRERALEVVAGADATAALAAEQRERARILREQGAALLEGIEPWVPEERKAAGWELQDLAEAAEREAVRLELERESRLEAALTHAPGLVEAHAELVELELGHHREAEAERDERRIARAAAKLREHAEALPEGHAARRRAVTYLGGDGALTLLTDVPGAEVELHRYERRNRRLVAVRVGTLGRTPLVAVSLPMGSYLCVVRHPERAEVRYPVHVGRGEHWDGIAPGERGPLPIRLPRSGELGPDDRLVAAGWSWLGGDPGALDGLTRRRVWCDELVLRRFPVTVREYLSFLDDLVASGREREAERHQPRERAAVGEGKTVFGRDDGGRFVLRPDADGDVWHPDWPVLLVDWHAANAYAAWLAERTGRPWRLPGELEWEKAARGVDGRIFPWGDVLDSSRCCIRTSHPGHPLPQAVDSFPVDESPYGIRGLGGNVQEWCADEYRRDGPARDGERLGAPHPVPTSAEAGASFVHRGGSWSGAVRGARSASRSRSVSTSRSADLGFRVAFRP